MLDMSWTECALVLQKRAKELNQEIANLSSSAEYMDDAQSKIGFTRHYLREIEKVLAHFESMVEARKAAVAAREAKQN